MPSPAFFYSQIIYLSWNNSYTEKILSRSIFCHLEMIAVFLRRDNFFIWRIGHHGIILYPKIIFCPEFLAFWDNFLSWNNLLFQGNFLSRWITFYLEIAPRQAESQVISGRRDFHGRKFTTRAGEPLGTYSYRTTGQSAKRNSRATLMSSYTRLFSSSNAVVAWPVQREHFLGELQKK